MRNIIFLLAFFTAMPCFAGSPDKSLHKQVVHPSVVITGETLRGSGVIVSSRNVGYWRNIVFTVAHVVKNQHNIVVHLPKYEDWSTLKGWEEFPADVVRIDVNADVAVLCFKSSDKLPTAVVDFKSKLYMGNSLYCVGGGLKFSPRLEYGKITSLNQKINYCNVPTVRTNLCMIEGDSGAGAFNNDMLVGIMQGFEVENIFCLNLPIHNISYFVPLRENFSEDDLK